MRNLFMTKKEFGDYLKQLRIARNLSQKNLAASLGYSTPQYVSNWERGRALPPQKLASELCQILELPLENYTTNMIKVKTFDFSQKLKFNGRG